MKRKICLWLAIVLIIVSLPACRKQRESHNSDAGTTAFQETTQPKELLVFSKDCNMLLQSFGLNYPEIQIRSISMENMGKGGIEDLVKEHGEPDLILSRGDISIEELVEKDLITAMGDMYENDSSINKENYFPGVFEVGKIGEDQYALPLSLDLNYMVIRKSQWENSQLSNLPEKYAFSDLLTAMEAQLDNGQEDGYIHFYGLGSGFPVELALEGEAIQYIDGEVKVNEEILTQLVRVLCKQKVNEAIEDGSSVSILHPALDPTAYEGNYLAACWGNRIYAAPQLGLVYAQSVNQDYYNEDINVVWYPGSTAGEYNAEVHTMAMIGKNTEHKEYVYDVIRKMMDMEIKTWSTPDMMGTMATYCPVQKDQAKKLLTTVEESESNFYCFNDMSGEGGVTIPKRNLNDELREDLLNYLDNITNVYRKDPTLYAGVNDIILMYTYAADEGEIINDYEACSREILSKIEENRSQN